MVLFTIFLLLACGTCNSSRLPDFTWAWLLPACRSRYRFQPGSLAACGARHIDALFAAGLGFYHACMQAEQRLAISLPEMAGHDIKVMGVVAELPRNTSTACVYALTLKKRSRTSHRAAAHLPEHLSRPRCNCTETTRGERWQLTCV